MVKAFKSEAIANIKYIKSNSGSLGIDITREWWQTEALMQALFNLKGHGWVQLQRLISRAYICGYCDFKVASELGYGLVDSTSPRVIGGLYICPNCLGATLISPFGKFPNPVMGNSVSSVPPALDQLYEEARRCTGQGCYTAAVLLCRKMLMNIAVEKGAEEGLRFIQYVDHLETLGYVPPDGRAWVDHIRKKGNEATHEIALMSEKDAEDLLFFLEMLLRFIYEFPGMFASNSPSTP